MTNIKHLDIGDTIRFEQFRIRLPLGDTLSKGSEQKFRRVQELFSRKRTFLKKLSLDLEHDSDSWNVNEQAFQWLMSELPGAANLQSLE
jgi:hypothetical protein